MRLRLRSLFVTSVRYPAGKYLICSWEHAYIRSPFGHRVGIAASRGGMGTAEANLVLCSAGGILRGGVLVVVHERHMEDRPRWCPLGDYCRGPDNENGVVGFVEDDAF